jgi:hypothetical protein
LLNPSVECRACDSSFPIVASFLCSTSAPSDTRRSLVAAIALSALALACVMGGASLRAHGIAPPNHAGAVEAARAARVENAPAALEGRLRSIRRAFLANSPEQILPCFVRDGPVFVRIAPLDRGAFLGPGPLDAFVRRLFAERVSVDFALRDAPISADGPRAFVTAAWTYRSSASSTLHVDHLHLVLSHAPEHAEWLIVEIKTSSR